MHLHRISEKITQHRSKSLCVIFCKAPLASKCRQCRTWNFHVCKVSCSCINHRPLLCFGAVTGVSKFVVIAQSCNTANFPANVKIHQRCTRKGGDSGDKHIFIETLGHADQELSQLRSWRHPTFKIMSLRDAQKSRGLRGGHILECWHLDRLAGQGRRNLAKTWQKPCINLANLRRQTSGPSIRANDKT